MDRMHAPRCQVLRSFDIKSSYSPSEIDRLVFKDVLAIGPCDAHACLHIGFDSSDTVRTKPQ
jgi:hypothetical protein